MWIDEPFAASPGRSACCRHRSIPRGRAEPWGSPAGSASGSGRAFRGGGSCFHNTWKAARTACSLERPWPGAQCVDSCDLPPVGVAEGTRPAMSEPRQVGISCPLCLSCSSGPGLLHPEGLGICPTRWFPLFPSSAGSWASAALWTVEAQISPSPVPQAFDFLQLPRPLLWEACVCCWHLSLISFREHHSNEFIRFFSFIYDFCQ